MKPFTVIVTASRSGGIGSIEHQELWESSYNPFNNRLISLERTKRIAIIMGKNKLKSLMKRTLDVNIATYVVITSSDEFKDQANITVVPSLDSALAAVPDNINGIFVVGGKRLFDEALVHPQCQTIMWTEILREAASSDIFIKPIDRTIFGLTTTSNVFEINNVSMQLLHYDRRHEELQYLDLVQKIIKCGSSKGDRTGVGTKSLFGEKMKFSLRDGSIPLFTTKKMYWRGIVEELLWMIAGKTDSKELAAKNVHIWDANGTREFLDKNGFTEREVGDLGEVYGFQWRHWGATYVDCKTDYSGKGLDQLQSVINTLKNNPNDRRILMSAWNPGTINNMALPPCHVMVQFYVTEQKELSCMMIQRSADMGLGVGFNVAFYSLLTCMIASLTGLKRGEFIHMIGDAHVYNNHIEALSEQVKRIPTKFPTLEISTTRDIKSIDEFVASDFILKDYYPHAAIKMDMAV